MKSFTKGLQVTLCEFLYLLSKLAVNLCFCMTNLKKAAHALLIINFRLPIVGITRKLKFCLWHCKSATKYPWIDYQCTTFVQPIVATL